MAHSQPDSTKSDGSRLAKQVQKIVAPAPTPTGQDGQGFFRWAVRKGLVLQQTNDKPTLPGVQSRRK